jgi:hypothetical protein
LPTWGHRLAHRGRRVDAEVQQGECPPFAGEQHQEGASVRHAAGETVQLGNHEAAGLASPQQVEDLAAAGSFGEGNAAGDALVGDDRDQLPAAGGTLKSKVESFRIFSSRGVPFSRPGKWGASTLRPEN